MLWLRVLFSRLIGLIHRNSAEQELNEEIRSHLQMVEEEKLRQGLSPQDARNAALREFGGVQQIRERYRQMNGIRLLETTAQDIRYSLRMMRRSPGFSFIIILLLALGIGANTAIFSAIDAVMLRLLPVKDPDQLVLLQSRVKDYPRQFLQDYEGSNLKEPSGLMVGTSFAYATYEYLRDHNHVFTDTFAFAANDEQMNVGLNGRAESAEVKGVSGEFFDALRVSPFAGHLLSMEDDRDNAPPAAVISHRFWQQKFGEDKNVVGKTIAMNGTPVTIIGVAPREFYGLEPGKTPDVWITLHFYAWNWAQLGYLNNGPLTSDQLTWWVQIAGRLKPGYSESDARAELAVLFDQNIKTWGGTIAPASATPQLGTTSAKQGLGYLRRRFSTSLLLLMGMVGLVLTIACSNVAGLLLARATARQKEIAVRLSLGAGRARLIRQLLTESVVLAVLGGLAGLFFALWLNAVLMRLLASGNETISLTLRIDGTVLAFTAAISVLCGLFFGLIPALRATRVEPLGALKQGTTSTGAGEHRFTSGRFLAAAQVTLCLVLLVGAGLFLRTLIKLQTVDLGFDQQHLLLFDTRPGLNGYKDVALITYYQELQRRLSGIPGVRSVSFSDRAPIGQGSSSTDVEIPGYTAPGESVIVYRHIVGPGYFNTISLPVVLGRPIGEQDTKSTPCSIVVNQKMAQSYFKGANPIGQKVEFGSRKRPFPCEIIGIVRDAKYAQLRMDVPPTVYFSYLQRPQLSNFMTFEVRGSGDAAVLVNSIRQQARTLDKDVPLVKIRTQTEVVSKLLFLERMFATLSSAFGGLALTLACVGLYGTMAYAVVRRTREIGVRMALGAARKNILAMILRETIWTVTGGLLVGFPLAWFATRLLQTQLFELTPHDPFTLTLATASIILVTAVAGYVPARRASRMDPMVALRYE